MDTQTLAPPSFIEGMTVEDLISWAKEAATEAQTDRLFETLGEDVAVDILLARYNRRMLIALLLGQVPPENEEQTVFLAEIEQGRPVSLLCFGQDRLAKQGFDPSLRKVNGSGWQYVFGDVVSEPYVDIDGCLSAYLNEVNWRL